MPNIDIYIFNLLQFRRRLLSKINVYQFTQQTTKSDILL